MEWIFIAGAAAFLVFGGVAVANTITEGQIEFIFWYKYDDLFKSSAAKYGIDWKWLKAHAIVESSLGQNPKVLAGTTSSDGKSWGLMQVTLATANDLRPNTTADDLNNPEISVDLAAKLISQLRARFPNDLRKMVISYNQGPGNTAKGNDFTGNYWQKWSDALELINKG